MDADARQLTREHTRPVRGCALMTTRLAADGMKIRD